MLSSGCTREVIVEVPKHYAVPVPCKTPDVVCKVSGSDVAVVADLVKCIVDYKRSNEVCK